MGDSTMIVVAIFLAAILMFVFPLMTTADKKDDISAEAIQKVTTEFLDSIRITGKITPDGYNNFVQTLAATGNSYQVDITVQVLDENPSKKDTTFRATIGNNVYYVMYTKQVLDAIQNSASGLVLKEGDIVSVDVENTNVTIGQQLRNFLFRVTGTSSPAQKASAAGIVITNGQ